MNTSPQMIIALLRQLTGAAGVRASDISICDSLAYLVNEYYTPLYREFPEVLYWDFAGKFGRLQVQPSSIPLYWSCRPKDVSPDFVPQCFAESEYLINFAQLKAHTATGVTLCGKNHFGSLVRWPVQNGYYDMHRNSFLKQTGAYREQVDLLGHAHLGGKTVLNLIDGLYSGTASQGSGSATVGVSSLRRALDLQPVGFPGPGRHRFGWFRFHPHRVGRCPAPDSAWTTISTRPLWPPPRHPARSTIRTTMRPRSRWPASASMSIGTTPRRRSTRAIWEPATGLS